MRRSLLAAPLTALLCAMLLIGGSESRADPPSAAAPTLAPLDLAGPFQTRSPWRLVANQGPATTDYGDNAAPGPIQLCLEKGPGGPCISVPVSTAQPSDPSDDWGPHYLKVARAVYPQGRAAPPLLQIVTASLFAGDGGQAVVTQLLKYDRASDAFSRVYFHSTGTNNNEEVRFVEGGPLRGAVIVAEPTEDKPYAYWVVVSRFTAARTYQQALRYRSATRYGDGNGLAVIDSEMPNIERRLGLWAPGAPLPLPSGGACPHPQLKQTELWCQ